MKTNLFFLISLLFISSRIFSQTADWTYCVGGTAYDYSECSTLDHSGAILTCGYYQNRVDFDPGPDSAFSNPYTSFSSHGFLTKKDANGQLIWFVSLEMDISSYALPTIYI